jgi:hypothetical protein
MMTSTRAVTKKVPPSLYLRSRMVTALAASPKLSGKVLSPVSLLVIAMPSCSTSRGPANSKPQKKGGSSVEVIGDLFLLQLVVTLN